MQKSAASDFKTACMSTYTSAAPSKATLVTTSAAQIEHQLVAQGSVERFRLSSYEPVPSEYCSDNRLFNRQVRLDNIASPSSQPSESFTGSTVHYDNTREILATSPPEQLRASPEEVSSEESASESDSSHHQQGNRIDHADYANNDSRIIDGERQPSFSRSKELTSTAALDEGEETDQWLSTAMQSASLKENNLAYSQVQGFLSSTPATNTSSWSSLFLKRSPRIADLGWSLSPLPKASPLTWFSVRSAEMPAPMLTGLVDEELRMSRGPKNQPINKAATRAPEPCLRDEHLMNKLSQSTHKLPRNSLLDEIDVKYHSKSRNNRTALMCAVAKRQRDVVYTLFKVAFTQGTWPTLSTSDDSGHTLLTLAEKAQFSHTLHRFLRLFVAVACCECAEGTRSDSVCGRIALRGDLEALELKTIDPGCRWGRKLRNANWPRKGRSLDWILEELRRLSTGPFRPPGVKMTHFGCSWGQKLRCLDWPGKEWRLEELLMEECFSESCTWSQQAKLRLLRTSFALEGIDNRIRELKSLNTDSSRAQRQRMLDEWVRCEVFFS
jgi:hypothetical protein